MTQPPGPYTPPSPAPTDHLLEPTPVSNNPNNEQLEEDTDNLETESHFTDCTATPKESHSSPETLTMSQPTSNSSSEGLSTAYSINASLSKISVNEELSDSNYISWEISIQRALRSVGLQSYIKDESSVSNSKNFDIHCDCITNWILNSMDLTNANRMQS